MKRTLSRVKKVIIDNKSKATAITLGLTMMIGITGCGTQANAAASGGTSPATTPSVTTISLWESHLAGGPPGKAMADLVNQFNQSHPTIKVNLVITKASHKALAALAAGDAPTMAEISHYDGNFLSAHALVNLNGILNKMSSAEQQAIFPAIWSNGEVNGNHYRLQADAKVSQLIYNKNLFEKAGISNPPTTWTQLATDAAILKAKLPGVIPIAWKDSSAHILPPFLANGGQLFKAGTKSQQADFLSPAAQTTFTYFHNLYQSGELILAHGSTIRADFGSGKLAIADGTSAGYFKALGAAGGKFPVGVFAYPKGSTGHSVNLVQGLGFVLMTGHSSVQDHAAGTFLRWWFTPQVQAKWAMESGYPPESKQALPLMSTYLSKYTGIKVATQILQSKYTISRPVSDNYKEVQSALDAAFYNAVTGKTSVSTALSQLQKQADGYLSGNSAL